MPRVLRDRARVSYYELEGPSFDEYLFCSSCGDYVYEYCAIHGPLLVIPDSEVPTPSGFPPFVPRAALTVPTTFLHLAPSTIPGAGIGVFSSLTLPRGVRFGPYRGMKTEHASSAYCWQILDWSHKPAHTIDASDANYSNWLRYVNCSRHVSEQNLLAYQYYGQLYYRTIKIIPPFTELLVFYGSESASQLNVDVRRYNAPAYTELLLKCEPATEEQKLRSINIELNRDSSTAGHKENMREHPNMLDKLKNIKQENDPTAKIYMCDYCKRSYIEKDHLITHIATHSTVKIESIKSNKKTIQKPSCSICCCIFLAKTDLINHLVNTHDSKMEYKACTNCDYKTVRNKDLRAHMETHSDIRKYKCDSCDYKAKTKSHLIKHKNRHLSGNCSCTTCGFKFPNKRMLDMHMITHNCPEHKFHTCTICGIAFKTNKGLKRHFIIHTARETFKCQTCNKCFYWRNSLNRHTKLH